MTSCTSMVLKSMETGYDFDHFLDFVCFNAFTILNPKSTIPNLGLFQFHQIGTLSAIRLIHAKLLTFQIVSIIRYHNEKNYKS